MKEFKDAQFLKKAMDDYLEPKLEKLRNSSFEIIKEEELAVAAHNPLQLAA